MLDSQRKLFDIPPGITYLRNSASSPMLKSSAIAAQAALRLKSAPWKGGSELSFGNVEEVRSLFASLIEASSDDIALIPSASYGFATAAKNVEMGAQNNVVLLENQFPSNVYIWKAKAEKCGAQIRIARRPDNYNWTSAVLENINFGTSVVAVPTCHWIDGSLIDLVSIKRRCEEVGAMLVVDGSQSIGAMPFDVNEVKPDFLVTVAEKWLLGPPQLAFMYVAPQHQNGEPVEFNWINRAGSEDYNSLINYTDNFKAGSRRFDVGARGPFITLSIAREALKQILRWKPDRINKTLRAWNDQVDAEVEAMGMRAVPSEARCGHMLGVYRKEGFPPDLVDILAAKNVYISLRGGVMRIAPHVYCDDEDIKRLLTALDYAIRPGGKH